MLLVRIISVVIALMGNMESYPRDMTTNMFGLNLNITDMQVAVGGAQLKKFPDFVERRRYNFNLLHKDLQEVQDKLILPEPCP